MLMSYLPHDTLYNNGLTSIISSISMRVILPSPSKSYILKAQLSFCSKLPREVMDRAQMNSLKSIVPSPFLSKVRKACWANLEASPYGKNCNLEKSHFGWNVMWLIIVWHKRPLKWVQKVLQVCCNKNSFAIHFFSLCVQNSVLNYKFKKKRNVPKTNQWNWLICSNSS